MGSATSTAGAEREVSFRGLLQRIVASPPLHARFLNTLSLMENCGARKIARFEHPVEVTPAILKHASEEFRHAFTLKRQIARVSADACQTYAEETLLAPRESRRYLDELEVAVSRRLKERHACTGWTLRQRAYLLVTWAIELRAQKLYPVYQEALDQAGSNVSVRPIIAEEEEHLAEMDQGLRLHCGEDWQEAAAFAGECEEQLFQRWHDALEFGARTGSAGLDARVSNPRTTTS